MVLRSVLVNLGLIGTAGDQVLDARERTPGRTHGRTVDASDLSAPEYSGPRPLGISYKLCDGVLPL